MCVNIYIYILEEKLNETLFCYYKFISASLFDKSSQPLLIELT